jgi:RNA polymerase sigma-70 factor (ECF subfamily)
MEIVDPLVGVDAYIRCGGESADRRVYVVLSCPPMPVSVIGAARRIRLPAATSERNDDYALMRAIAGGDSAALKALYDHHGGVVHALCLRMLRDAGEAEQLLTDVFFEIWNSRDRYDESRATPLTYLMRLTRSRAIDRLRRKNLLGQGVSLDPAAGIDVAVEERAGAGVEAEESRAMIARALAVLDRDQRAAIECAYYDGLSHTQIAERLNKPLGTVKSALRTGLVRLREILSARLEMGGNGGEPR